MSHMTGLRRMDDADHNAVFRMMADPQAVEMAAFTADDPTDRNAFDAHLARVLSDPSITHRVVVDGSGTFVGTIALFPSDEGHLEVTYWIDRDQWGRGHASRALGLVLADAPRPVLARVAIDNLASRRVLEKAGFVAVGRDRNVASGRGTELDELLLRLDSERGGTDSD
jgi:RimJ/RimL family protein N-acetyltransferase